MTRGGWYSQRFQPDGSMPAEGMRDQLGRPRLSLLTVLVREAAQNSWDAGTGGDVAFRLDLAEVNVSKMSAWRELLGSAMPPGDPANFPLRKIIRGQTVRYLAVSDRGTVGLPGPTRADITPGPGERRNWTSFVLNSGDNQKADAGGTYGYGKGVFFKMSRVGTALIYTRFQDPDGELRSRLIGSTVMTRYSFGDEEYTGRHWWGVPTQDHCVPFEDDEADDLAARLGLPMFRGGKTGTSVVVVDPDLTDPAVPDDGGHLEELNTRDAATLLADAAAWNLWPLTLHGRSRRLQVTVTGDGLEVPVADERTDPTLESFAAAYRTAVGFEPIVAMCGRPKRRIGSMGAETTFGADVQSYAASEHEISGSPHHFALMRGPDLVVQYVAGPKKLNPNVGYVGVFKAAADLEDVFGRAEPPTHDAWVDSMLKGADQSFVRMAYRRVKELSDELAGVRVSAVQAEAVAVGSLSQRLGHLMSGPGAWGAVLGATGGSGGNSEPHDPGDAGGGEGGSEDSEAGRRRPSPKPRKPTLVGVPTYEIVHDHWAVRQTVSIGTPGKYLGVCLVVTGDGAHEAEQPAGASRPTVYAWRSGNRIRRGEVLEADVAGEYDLIVEPVQDVVFDISVEAVS